ncbi:hypothetical protein [Marinomonas atlantica]|uniref:hypothetical protein n=1 Tax=Marinomonas atlantica TaxID=1806668 RepID=UPI00082A61C5|nr:hypothetical protein [Marinomonas atlantica]MCO4786839.1 hypothetical protein [Marinomonas atlantica]
MLKRLFSRKSSESISSNTKQNIKPQEHNRSEFVRLVDSFKMNNPDCDVLSAKDLEQKFTQFAEQNKLGVTLQSHYISHGSPEKLQRLLSSGYYGATIKNGITKIEKSDKDFSWAAERDVIGALYMDRGFFILVRAVNRKVGFNRRWVFDLYLSTRNFA